MSKNYQPAMLDTTEFTWDVFPVKVEVMNGEAWLLQSGEIFKTHNPFKDAPDLFLRFIELKDHKDVVEFVNEWGLLGIGPTAPDEIAADIANTVIKESFYKGWHETREYSGEQLDLAYRQQQQFAEIHKVIESQLEDYSQDKELQLLNTFSTLFTGLTTPIVYKKPTAKRPEIGLRPRNLMAAMTIQLYGFWVERKQLHKCKLPSCNRLTTTKFCSSGHKAYYSILRKRIETKPNAYLKKYSDVLDQLFEPDELKDKFGIGL